MSEKTILKPLALALGTTFVTSLAGTGIATAADNPFGMSQLSSGYMVAEIEGKCGAKAESTEGKCGAKAESTEGKCGAKAESTEGKCGAKAESTEGKCGAKAEKTEGKCGEGKCGASK